MQRQTEQLRRVYEEKVHKQREATEERMAGGFAHEMLVKPRGNMQQVQARVIRPFFSTKGTAETGLNLDLSRKLARRHGGDLTFEPEPGKGTTFSLTLPAGDKAQKTSMTS